jgi:protein SCO1/2
MARPASAKLCITLATLAGLATGARAADAADAHAHHHHHAAASSVQADAKATRVEINLPATMLLDSQGRSVTLASELADKRPVLLNFIFTTCTAICPVMTQVFANVQDELGADRNKVRMVSISIDPEQDTPAALAKYAERFHAGPQWSFLTGTPEASVAVQKAFGSYRGDKMNHEAVTFLRPAPGKSWVRIDGLAKPASLLNQVKAAVAGKFGNTVAVN